MKYPSFTCVIPAFNEADRLPGVLAAVMGHPFFDRVLVVDDGSSDKTTEIALRYGAELLPISENRGKTRALRLGLEAVRTSHVVLVDADLVGLTHAAITALIAPVVSGHCFASVSLRGNAPWIWRRIGIDYISGERVFPIALIVDRLEALDDLPRFGFEAYLNELLVAGGQPISIVHWPEVISPTKVLKRGLWHGLIADAGMIVDIAGTIGVSGFARQIHRLWRLSRPGFANQQQHPFSVRFDSSRRPTHQARNTT